MSESSPNPMPGADAVASPSPSLTSRIRGAQEDALRHAVLLDRCFGDRGARWSDALVARARRHVGGAVATVETGLRLELGKRAPLVSGLVDALPQGCAWTTIGRAPALLDPALFGHFRDRAAISLMQQFGPADADAEPGAAVAALPEEVGTMLAGLRLALAGWADSGPDDAAMRTDLPAEIIADLVWTVAAILADAVSRTGLMSDPAALALLDGAGRAVLARHDEQNGPVGLAALLAHRLRGVPPGQVPLADLARERQVLALVAIAAERTGCPVGTAMNFVVEASEQRLFTFFRAADFPREAAVRLVLARRCVASGADDATLIGYADAYESLAPEAARAAMAALAVAPPLRQRLALLRDGEGPGHGF